MKRFLLTLTLCLCPELSWAANSMCPTRPAGDSTNACASTAFTTNGIAANFSSPPPLGNITPNTVAATTLSASGLVSGAGFTSLFASPPPIGATAPGTIAATNLSNTGTFVSPQFPGASSNVLGTGFAGLLLPSTTASNSTWFIQQTPANTTAALQSALYVQRNSLGLSGGTTATVPSALLVQNFSGRNDISWNSNIASTLFNQTLGTNGSIDTAGLTYALKQNSTGGGEVGATFGSNSYCWDQQPTVNPAYPCIGEEIDAFVSAGGGADTNGERIALTLHGGVTGGTDAGVHIGAGLQLSADGLATVDKGIAFLGGGTFGTLITTRVGTVTATSGIDWTNVTFSGNAFKSSGFVVDNVGNESAQSYSSTGTVPINTGTCAINTQLGGKTAGSFKANGSCAGGTYILSMPTATNGWACQAQDLTTITDTVKPSGVLSTTLATFTATTANADLITFSCVGF